ncbi:hypothetical protein [Pseudoalteromonas rubra]|uniref:Alginate export domain-containing protein n=1 Tax=Pseudoalteromonas rubra TaxID=43658 RepID=A0A0U2Z4N7_9GAMM|nr:hypothetical protein [Pseudoalteromonas rubra]ALU42737.1 hypothetical protein AT705_07060 [Pseudoalteromonas rubra]
MLKSAISLTKKTLLSAAALGCALATSTLHAAEFELSGKVGAEQRYFFNEGQYQAQLGNTQASVYIEPELYWSWDDGVQSVTFKPYYRFDERDSERDHGDIRELSYVYVGDDWELRAGIRKEFWGVTEFQHLVDVINQTDSVEDFDGEDKLGQQMLNLSLVRDWGIVDLYVLPGFRERTFNGKHARLRSDLIVDTDSVRYESSAEEHHLDFAARWSHSIDVFDLGVYWFHGTNREPILAPRFASSPDTVNGNVPIGLSPYYLQMDQLGADIQATVDDWLWKFETIYRSTSEEDFVATQAGVEYTYVGVFNSVADLGLLVEYAWDSRGEGDQNNPGAAMQNDVFMGARLALNDIQSSELLMGFGSDLDHSAVNFILEANRRLGEDVKVSIDIRLMQSSEPTDFLYSIKEDDHVQLSLEWYF